MRIASARVGVGPGAAGARVVISRLRLGVQAAAVANLRAYAWDPIGKVSRPVRVYAWDPASKTATLLAGVIPTGGGGGSGGGTGGGGATSGGYPGAYPAHYPPPATGTGGLPSGAGFDLDGFDMDGWL